jgi:WD40 repeat protein
LGAGLTWLARGLEILPANAPELEQSLRNLIGAWSDQAARLERDFKSNSRVTTAAASPNGQWIVTGELDRQARMWDVRTGKPIAPSASEAAKAWKHANPLLAVGISPDGETVMTVTEGSNGIRTWDRTTGKPKGKELVGPARLHSAVFSPNGKYILTGCRDRRARLWDLRTGKALELAPVHRNPVCAVAFSRDGKYLATGCTSGLVQVWNAGTGAPLGKPLLQPGKIQAIAFSRDGNQIATACHDRNLRLWRWENGSLVGVTPHPEAVLAAAFSGDGNSLVTGCKDGTVRLLDPNNGKILVPLAWHQGPVEQVEFLQGDKEILTVGFTARVWRLPVRAPQLLAGHKGSVHLIVPDPKAGKFLTAADREARLWALSDKEGQARQATPVGGRLEDEGNVNGAAFSPDGTMVLARIGRRAVLWSAADGHKRGKSMVHEGNVLSAVFCPDGREILTASEDGAVGTWSAATAAPLGKFNRVAVGKGADLSAWAQFHPDGATYLTAGMDKRARIWSTKTREPASPWFNFEEPLTYAAYRPDGKAYLLRGAQTVWLCNSLDGKAIGQPLRHPKVVQIAQFSPDNRLLATLCFDGGVRLWNGDTGRSTGLLLRHPDAIMDFVFHPNGQALLTRSWKGVRLWASRTGLPLSPILDHPGTITAASYDPKGRAVLTATLDGKVQLFDAGTGHPLGQSLPMGEFLGQKPAPMAAAFSGRGDMAIAGATDGTVRLWPVPPAASASPKMISMWVEIMTGLGIDDSGAVVPMDNAAWNEKFKQFLRWGERLSTGNRR